jgi:hypothetical protein
MFQEYFCAQSFPEMYQTSKMLSLFFHCLRNQFEKSKNIAPNRQFLFKKKESSKKKIVFLLETLVNWPLNNAGHEIALLLEFKKS